ncbi:MAG TPA: dual specificity protein phosphatase family protein [Cellvibrionaceae bacterium]
MTNSPQNTQSHLTEPESHPWGWALLAGALLGVIFFATYNNVNQYTATLEPVPSFYFAWEHRIPFWPWTIVPYWTIDLFYGLALFLAATRASLLRLVKRLLLAQVLCISAFLFFPLKFAFQREATDGMFGSLFTALAQFDLPYNQAPSLHIVLLLVLWRQYRLYTRGSRWRYGVDGWCWLIALSVLTTWQHHVIDLLSGLWAGAFCLLAVPEQPGIWRLRPEPIIRRRQLARYYALGATALALPAWQLWPSVTASLLCWVACALGYVAAVYLGGSAAHLGKQADGRIAFSHYAFLAPYYWGARINVWYHLRTRPQVSQIVPGVYLGALCALPQLILRLEANPGLVDLTAELPVIHTGTYRALPTLDLLPIASAQLRTAAQAIDQTQQLGPVLVACALGVSRSAAAIAAWLVCYRNYSVEAALELLTQQRSCVIISSAQREQLLALADV